MMIGRREFLKTGLAGSVMLGLAGCAGISDDQETAMLTAISAALLAGALTEDADARETALAETVRGVRHAIAGLSINAQKEVAELFSLLTLAPARRFVAGVSSPWHEASGEDVAAFLESWRFSRFALLQSAYAALHDLVFGAWYARPENWPAIGYPGSPEVF